LKPVLFSAKKALSKERAFT